MKKSKLSLSVLVVILLVAFLCACTGNTNATTPSSNTTAPVSSSNTDTAAQSPSILSGKDIYKDPITIAWIPISTAGVINQVVDIAFNECLAVYPNVSLIRYDPAYDVNKTISAVTDAISQKVDGIMLMCIDPAALSDSVTQAEQAGIPVITIDNTCFATHTFHIQGSDYGSGQIAGKAVADKLGGKGNIVILDAPAALKSVALMSTGFTDYITANTQCKIIEDVSIDAWSQENAAIAMRDLLTKYPSGEIQAVFAVTDDLSVGALQAIEAAGRLNEIVIHGDIGSPQAFQAIKDGKIYGSVFSNTYAHYYTAIYMTLNYIQTGTTSITAGYTSTPMIKDTMIPVTKDNIDAIIALARYPQ